MLRILLIVAVLLPLQCAAWWKSVRPVVEVQFGTIRGAFDESLAVAAFKGVPFAEPAERFARAAPWTGRYGSSGWLNATRFPVRSTCPQTVYDSSTMSEDCLYLSIFVPWNASTQLSSVARLPVMMWIHGGALSVGSAMPYDGSHLASKEKVIVVVPNYRVGPLGFAATLQPHGPVANLGLTDQQEAMRWIRANIEPFGGDSKQLTIFGQSAGGQSVLYQMISPESVGLFDKAISESGDFFMIDSLDQNLRSTEILAQKVGCKGGDDVSCLRDVDVGTLIGQFYADKNLTDRVHFAVYGDQVIPGPPLQLIADGKAHSVPYISGSNHDEFYDQLAQYLPSIGANVVKCAMNKTMSSQGIQTVLETYQLEEEDPEVEMANLVQFLTDVGFRCPNLVVLRALSAWNKNLWSYNFARVADCHFPAGVPGACHSAEIPFVFNGLDVATKGFGCSPSADDYRTADHIGKYWAAFAGLGADDFVRVTMWQRVFGQKGTENTLKINVSMSMETDYRRKQCSALETIGLDWPSPDNFPITRAIDACKNTMEAAITV